MPAPAVTHSVNAHDDNELKTNVGRCKETTDFIQCDIGSHIYDKKKK